MGVRTAMDTTPDWKGTQQANFAETNKCLRAAAHVVGQTVHKSATSWHGCLVCINPLAGTVRWFSHL